MPRVFRKELRVPDHAVGPFGELRPSGIARLLQEIATDASADAGYSPQWYRSHGAIWIVRRTTLEVGAGITAGSIVGIATWVADFRRVRSLREYEIDRGGEILVRARTDWVYMDLGSARPARIPEEMTRAFAPEGPATPRPRPSLTLLPRSPDAFTTERRVELRDLDSLGHVNNTVYLDYLDDSALRSLAARGFGLDRWLAEGGHLRPVRVDVEYLAEARYGDGLAVTTWTGEVSDAGFERCAEIRLAAVGTLLTQARSRWAWMKDGVESPLPAALRP